MDTPAEDADADTDAVMEARAAAGHNGLGTYNLIHATILAGQPSATQLTDRSLSTSGVGPLVRDDICNDGTSSEAFKYLVECALTSDHDVAVSCPGKATRHYEGRYGVSNGWSSGACDEACRQRVSACMIGLTNFRSIDGVEVNMVGSPAVFHPISDAGFNRFSVEEGTYWGDVFNRGSGQEINGCRVAGSDDAITTPTLAGNKSLPAMRRVCTEFTSANPVCKVCDHILNQDVMACDPALRRDYFHNLNANSMVPLCTRSCNKRAVVSGKPANNGYWTDCAVKNDANSSNTVTIWRSR